MTDKSSYSVNAPSNVRSCKTVGGRTIAAPSWVINGSIHENCCFLEGKVAEVGLVFFERDACLAYTDADLPDALKDLALSWHVHLPLDFDWTQPEPTIASALALMDKISYLGAHRAVLHPPLCVGGSASVMSVDGACKALAAFVQGWQRAGRNPADILIENINGNDLMDIWPVIAEYGVSVCLDTGHLFAYGQEHLLEQDGLLQRVKMVHLNAPGETNALSKHRALSYFTEKQAKCVQAILRGTTPDTVLMMELFAWEHIESSLPFVREAFVSYGDKA